MKLIGLNDVGIRSKGIFNGFQMFEVTYSVYVEYSIENTCIDTFLRNINSQETLIPILYNNRELKYFHEAVEFLNAVSNLDKLKNRVVEYLELQYLDGIDARTYFLCNEVLSLACNNHMVVLKEDEEQKEEATDDDSQ